MFLIRTFVEETHTQMRYSGVPIGFLFCVLVVASDSAACASDANELFATNCAVCHGKDGKATSSIAKKLGVKDLSQSRISDAQIEQQIREGRPADQNSAKMPAFKDRLTAQEIRSLIPVVKKFRPQTKADANQTS